MKKIELATPSTLKAKSLYYERKMEKVRQRNKRVLSEGKKQFLLSVGVAK
jgi:hypothetical protein